MSYRYTVGRALALVLAVSVLFGAAGWSARAGQQQQEPSNRPRRAGETATQQQTPQTPAPRQTPTPAPKQDDADAIDEDDVLRVETALTNVLFTAVDKNKRCITTLTQDDIRVFEDGNPQEVFAFQRETDRALSLAILIDTSASQERTLPEGEEPRAASLTPSSARARTRSPSSPSPARRRSNRASREASSASAAPSSASSSRRPPATSAAASSSPARRPSPATTSRAPARPPSGTRSGSRPPRCSPRPPTRRAAPSSS